MSACLWIDLFVCSCIFCRYQPRPWLALFLHSHVDYGGSDGIFKAGVAIGLEMVALLALQNGRLFQFLIWIFCFILPCTCARAFDFDNNHIWLCRSGFLQLLWLCLWNLFCSDSLSVICEAILMLSTNLKAWVRVVLSLIPALVFLVNRRNFQLGINERRTWTLLSLMSVASFILLIAGVSSTAVDRMALYLIPLQLFVGSRIPDIRPLGVESGTWNLILILLSFFVLSIWLLFAANAYAWTPYRNLLFFY